MCSTGRTRASLRASSPFREIGRSHAREARERRRECTPSRVLSQLASLKNGELDSRLNETPADSRFFAGGERGREVSVRRVAHSFYDKANSFLLSAMEVGVINSATFINNTKMESMEFPKKHPEFNGKNMADSIAIHISELPKTGKERC